MRNVLFVILTALCLQNEAFAETPYLCAYEPETIPLDLIQNDDRNIDEDAGAVFKGPDWKDCLKTINMKVYLEFGAGYWTKFFLEQCNKVISVEFVTPGYGPETIKRYLGVYANYSNWTPYIYFSANESDTKWAPYKYLGSEHVHRAASYQCATHGNYALTDDFYLVELNAFIKNLVKFNKIQVALVNSGLYIRGDLVQLLFGKVPVIFAHDTDCRAAGQQNDVYGYSRIDPPHDYEEIYLQNGQGITAWVLKDKQYRDLIQALKKL